MLFVHYAGCSTCKKAAKWLQEQGIEYTARPIKEENPTVEELAEALHITAEAAASIGDMLETARMMAQIKKEPEPEEEAAEENQAVEDTAYFQMRQRIADLLSELSEEDAKLITLRYGLEGGLPLNPQDTGKRLGLTPDEVVAREAAALAKLRKQ